MPQLKVTLSIGFANGTREDILDIHEDEWAKCTTDDEREYLMNEYWKDWSNDYIDGGIELIEDKS